MRKWIACLAALVCALIAPSAWATVVFNKGGGTGQPSIWSAADDGSGQKRLAAGGLGPRISPDGRTVAYQSVAGAGGRPQLVTMPAAGGRRSVLLDPQWGADTQAWSPDSRTIAAVTGREVGTKRLVLVDVASGVVRTVATGQFYGVSFSPSGGALVYARAATESYPPRSALWLAPTGAGTPVRITSGHSDVYPVWGPRAVVFARERKPTRRFDAVKQDLYLMAPGDTAPKRLTFQKPPFLMTGLTPVSWSADGSRLLGQFGGQDTAFAQTIDPLTGSVRTVGRQADPIVGSALSRDGSTILGTKGGVEGGDPGNVVTVPYGGGKPTVLVKHAFSPDWNR
jgi:Tol biopolymer transport system component